MLKSCHCPITGVRICCPLCKHLCENAISFKDHMLEAHRIPQGHKDHFDAWRKHCEELDALDVALDRYKQRPPHILRWDRLETLFGSNISRLSCTWPTTGAESCQISRHFDLRGDLTELKFYHRQILALYPEFGLLECWRPVWQDLLEPLRPTSEEDADAGGSL